MSRKKSDPAAIEVREIKKSLELVKGNSGTEIYAVAVGDNPDKTVSISAKDGVALHPLVHDLTKDAYLVSGGVSYLNVGQIPVNYTLFVDNFFVDIPLPEPVFRKYLSETQIAILDDWLDTYLDYEIQFLQVKRTY